MVKNKHLLTEIENINRLIGYDRSKPVLEQPESVMDRRYGIDLPDRSEPVKIDPNEWKKECKYPNKAKMPSDGKFIKGYCLYPAPKVTSKGDINLSEIDSVGTVGVWIPNTSTVEFRDTNRLIGLAEKIIEKDKETKYDLNNLVKNLNKTLPLGAVSSFSLGSDVYVTKVTRFKPSKNWLFKGYFFGDKQYVQPEWVDERSEYQQFVDEWGTILQLSVIVGTIVAGVVTGGGAWVLTIEIILELSVGLMVGLRELERGENVAATVSFVTALLPMLKLTKIGTGFSDNVFNELAKKINDSKLTKSSTLDEYIEFYKTLNDTEKILLKKITNEDEIRRFTGELKSLFENPEMLFTTLNKNPEIKKLFKEIPTRKKILKPLWQRELSANVFVAVTGVVFESVYGTELTQEERDKLSGVYVKIPDEHKQKFVEKVLTNDELLDEVLKVDINKSEEYDRLLNSLIDKPIELDE